MVLFCLQNGRMGPAQDIAFTSEVYGCASASDSDAERGVHQRPTDDLPSTTSVGNNILRLQKKNFFQKLHLLWWLKIFDVWILFSMV